MQTVNGFLLDFDLRAGFGELLGDVVGLFLGDVLLDGLRAVVDEVLGFLQAQAGDLTDDLDDLDLVGAEVRENGGELGLLLRGGSSGGGGGGGDGDRSGGGNAELFLKRLDELGELQNG